MTDPRLDTLIALASDVRTPLPEAENAAVAMRLRLMKADTVTQRRYAARVQLATIQLATRCMTETFRVMSARVADAAATITTIGRNPR